MLDNALAVDTHHQPLSQGLVLDMINMRPGPGDRVLENGENLASLSHIGFTTQLDQETQQSWEESCRRSVRLDQLTPVNLNKECSEEGVTSREEAAHHPHHQLQVSDAG